MADEKKPLTDGEQETAAAEDLAEALTEKADTAVAAEAAETAAESAADETAAEVDAIVKDALNPSDSTDAPAAAPAENSAAETSAEAPKKPAPRKKPAKNTGLAAILPQKKKKKRPRKRTIEDELADLAAEEAAFDAWGRPIKKKKKHKRRKTRKLSCTLVLLTLILALSSVLSVLILAVAKEMYGIDKVIDQKIITIEEGAGTRAIAEQLVKEDIISLPQVFRLVSRMNGKDGSYIAGEHVLRPNMSYEAMIDELCKNYKEEGRESVKIVIPEGTTLLKVSEILEQNEVCNGELFRFYFNSGGYHCKFEQYLPPKSALKFQQMEGYCFPDTYEFYVNEDPSIVAQKIYANFDSKLSDSDYKKMNELGRSLDEIITLASMIQGEAGKKSDMPKISSVFHNRLLHSAEFPKLQSDPTKKYAEDVIAPNLDRDNETMRTAYNTYEGNGLPPGAINNPGKDAIQAALYPDSTAYFYFNANIDTKETFFAENYDQHLENLAKVQRQYQEAEAAQNQNAGNE